MQYFALFKSVDSCVTLTSARESVAMYTSVSSSLHLLGFGTLHKHGFHFKANSPCYNAIAAANHLHIPVTFCFNLRKSLSLDWVPQVTLPKYESICKDWFSARVSDANTACTRELFHTLYPLRKHLKFRNTY
jgi:hypothetical protein